MKIPTLPKATGTDAQYRLMLCDLANETVKQLKYVRFWQIHKRKILETMLFNIYQAIK